MKHHRISHGKEYEQLSRTLTAIPVVDRCEHIQDGNDMILVSLVFKDETRASLEIILLPRAFPSIIAMRFSRTIREQKNQEPVYPVIIAPYISREAAEQCERLGIGYMDMSGNCRLLVHSIYVSDRGHPNRFVKKRPLRNIFDPSSKVSSLILREIMKDTEHRWKLSTLSDALQCSIGQVSKVKDFLCEQLWARMTVEGIHILDPEAIMGFWSEAYGRRSTYYEVVNCYTLLPLPDFEQSLRQFRAGTGIDCYLTGLAGGARYAPVVRYTAVEMMIRECDLSTFLEAVECKPVNSGANVKIRVLPGEEMLHDARIIREQQVVSPVQVYLDCMQNKGRGEEMAEAILMKEILTHDTRRGTAEPH